MDAEGYDGRILEQLDMSYWSPRVVSLEAINLPRNELLQVGGFFLVVSFLFRLGFRVWLRFRAV